MEPGGIEPPSTRGISGRIRRFRRARSAGRAGGQPAPRCASGDRRGAADGHARPLTPPDARQNRRNPRCRDAAGHRRPFRRRQRRHGSFPPGVPTRRPREQPRGSTDFVSDVRRSLQRRMVTRSLARTATGSNATARSAPDTRAQRASARLQGNRSDRWREQDRKSRRRRAMECAGSRLTKRTQTSPYRF